MKTAIVSDIHGNFADLKLVLDDIASRQVDRIICLGDLVDGGEENDAVVQEIRNRISPKSLTATDFAGILPTSPLTIDDFCVFIQSRDILAILGSQVKIYPG